MSTLLSTVGSFLTAALGWAGDIVDVVIETPILMIGFIMSIAGFGVGLVKRLINL